MRRAALCYCFIVMALPSVGYAADAAAAASRRVAEAKAAVRANPESAAAHRELAIACGHLTDHTGNREKMELSRTIHSAALRATELDPNDALAWEILGRWEYGFATLNPVLRLAARVAYGKLPDASLAEAARLLQRSVALDGGRISSRHHLALVLKAMGRKEEARAQWRAVLTLAPADAEDRASQQAARAALKP